MKISLNWIKDFVDLDNIDYYKLADKITKAGVNVEKITTYQNDLLEVGLVKSCDQHPDSAYLKVCQVELSDGIYQIVCGAPNINYNMKVIVAKEGCILPGDIKIKKTVIRGIESNGMICSLEELELEEKSSGIYELNKTAIVGDNPYKYLGLDDCIYELDLNPNREDCLSHLGFAYEVGAVLNKNVSKISSELKEIEDSIKNYMHLDVQTENCSMYLARMVKNIKIGPSPEFIKNRLINAGMRSINNVVDISNYIMLEYGQPLHFFDQEKIGNQIVVKMAEENEKVTTLDNIERSLIASDIVISNQDHTIAIAGVMGTKNSEIDDDTKNIIIESAIFNPYNVRYTAIRLNLRSESSLRFEKRLNYEYTKEAIDKACFLLAKYASGEILKDTITYDAIVKNPKIIKVTKTNINNLLGMMLTEEQIEDALNRLQFEYSYQEDTYTVNIPNRAVDINIKEDLIEEIGRIVGYDNIVPSLPSLTIKAGKYNDQTAYLKSISKKMRSLGFYEARTYTLVSYEENLRFNNDNYESIKLRQPMSNDKSVIRKGLIPSLLNVANYNLSHQIKDINIYEISTTYAKHEDEIIEQNKLGFLVLGNYLINEWQQIKIKYDYFIVKGIIERLFDYLGFTNRYKFITNDVISDLHPHLSTIILIDNEEVGYFGRVHPNMVKEDIFVGEINLDKLKNKRSRQLMFKEASKYPSIIKDVAFVIEQNISSDEIISLIKKTAGNLLTDCYIFDIYNNDSLGPNKKSIAFKLTFNDYNKTLTEEEVMIIFGKIIDIVTKKYNCTIRTN
ncbi:MAG: phenylalanine--tRNA ligase subunit beta [Tenericutes bacterium]|jgi:phenylalanyl-tRNA synthetase beta chain|nr:phenylalanine--tRNA ligase subunit beta [Mycoplasmatota bacterium]